LAKSSNQRSSSPRPPSLVAAVEVGGARLRAGLIDEQARLLVRGESDLASRSSLATAAAITRLILELAAAPERGPGRIKAIGLSVAGGVDPQSGRVTLPDLKNWYRVALGPLIERELTATGLDIRRPPGEHRARAESAPSAHPVIGLYARAACLAAGEVWSGAARGKRHVVYLDVGHGIEAGIIVEGRVLAGADGFAGAAGWLAPGESFKSEFVGRGGLSAEASAPGLLRRAIESWSRGSDDFLNRLIATDAAALTPELIIRAARGGDPHALRLVHETCRFLGRGMADLIAMLNPEAIVLGGDLGLALKPFLEAARREAETWAPPPAARRCRIVSARLGAKAGLLGAARLAFLSLAASRT